MKRLFNNRKVFKRFTPHFNSFPILKYLLNRKNLWQWLLKGGGKQKDTALILHTKSNTDLIPYKPPNTALIPYKPPNKDLIPYKPPNKDLIPYKPPNKDLILYKPPSKDLILYKPPSKDLILYKPPSKELIPFNEISRELIEEFSRRRKSKRGWTSITGSWWFTSLAMACLYYWFKDEEDPFVQPNGWLKSHDRDLQWADWTWNHCSYSAAGWLMWGAKTTGIFDVDQYLQTNVDSIPTLSSELDLALGGFKLGINPGPFSYSFERSDPSKIFKYAIFLMVAKEDDWADLVRIVGPIPSADKLVQDVRKELSTALMYPTGGFLVGSVVGFALPLNVPITTVVLAYNAVGGVLAYSKGIADLDEQISKSMPKLHGALSNKVDSVVAGYFRELSESYKTHVESTSPSFLE